VEHFAAFPMELPRTCILGWSPPGICTACGEGRRLVTSVPSYVRLDRPHNKHNRPGTKAERNPDNNRNDGTVPYGTGATKLHTITGYACACPAPDAPTRPAVVVDPFGGTGTTAVVADAYGRAGITVDRSQDYSRFARWRTSDPAQRAAAGQRERPAPVRPVMTPAGQGTLDALLGMDTP
jgi:hypothetical protein